MRFLFIAVALWTLGVVGANAALLPGSVAGGGLLEKGAQLTGVGGGVALGTTRLGGSVNHDWVVLQAYYGVVVSDLLAEEQFLSGRLVLAGEFLFAQQFRPDSGVLVGATPLVRYVFETSGRVKPFVEVGVGFALTDIGAPSLGGTVQFSPQGGVGFLWFLKRDLALTGQQRLIHYSNGGRRSPNAGINQYVLLLGLTRFH